MGKSRYPITVNKKLGFIDDTGAEIIPPSFTAPPGAQGLTGFHNDVAWVFINNKYALIDTEGNVLFDCDFDNVHTFSSNGYAKVWPNSEYGKGLSSYEQTGAGLINKKGEFVIQPIYKNLFDWHDERIVFVKNDKNGVIDYQENEIIPPNYSSIWILDGEKNAPYYFIVENEEEMQALFSAEGKQITDFKYYDIDFSFCDGLVKFEKNALCGFLNTKLEEVIPAQFEEAKDFSCGVASVSNKEDLYGYIDQSGKLIIPCKYQEAFSFTEDVAAVSEDGKKYGFINKKGEWVIKPQYDDVHTFTKGLAQVQKDGKTGYINVKNETIIPFDEYEWVDDFDFVVYDDVIFIKFKKNGKAGFYNSKGELAIEPKFNGVSGPKGKLIKVADGYIDFYGNYVWKQPPIPEPSIDFSIEKYPEGNDPSLLKSILTEKGLLEKFDPPMKEEEIKAIEEKHNFTFPEDFRNFIKEIGNGGPGPMDGMFSDVDFLDESFDLDKPFIPSALTDSDEEDAYDKEGVLVICSNYIETVAGVVTTGSETGKIWFANSQYWLPFTPKFRELVIHFSDDYSPFSAASEYVLKNHKDIPRMTFNDWYYDWLKNQ